MDKNKITVRGLWTYMQEVKTLLLIIRERLSIVEDRLADKDADRISCDETNWLMVAKFARVKWKDVQGVIVEGNLVRYERRCEDTFKWLVIGYNDNDTEWVNNCELVEEKA